jgi:hypothetical protein
MRFKGFTIPDDMTFPPELREIIPDIKTVAELKLLLIILDAYFQAGLDAQPLTFDQLQKRTKLARQSVNDGLKKLLANDYIQRLTAGDTYAYEPSLESRLPCHESLDSDSQKVDSHDIEHDHAWRSRIWTALVKEFGVSSRVAEDIALNRDPAYVQRHIDYAHYEIKTGFQPKRPAGYIVARIRDDRPMPLGYTDQDFDDLPEADPNDLPHAADNHQRCIDKANGGGNGTDPSQEIAKHLFWGFERGQSDLPPAKDWKKWQKGGERLLRRLPRALELCEIIQRIDAWFADEDNPNAFWCDNPLHETALDIIARFVKNGGNRAATNRRPDNQRDPGEEFFDPESGKLVRHCPDTGDLIPVS